MDITKIAPQIIQTEIDGVKATCIVLGDTHTHLPGYLLQGKSQIGFALKDGLVNAIPWEGIAIVDGMQCLRLPSMPLYSVWELADKRRGETLSFVRDFIQLLGRMEESYISLESGTIPLWRMYGLDGGGVFLLPPSLSSAIEACMGEQAREASFNDWVHYDLHKPYTLIDQMAQLLYLGATGRVPLANPDTREDHCDILPLRLLGTNLEPDLVRLVDDVLHAKLTEQRDLTGNQQPQHALSWLGDQLASMQWPGPVESRPDGDAISLFEERQRKRAARRRFWRKRGWLVVTITAIVLAVGCFTAGRIKQALTPPYTYGMSDEQIIAEYYAAQSELDVQKLDASLAPHVKSPAELEVMNLFVNRQTRQAYENINAIINVNDWIAQGRPAIGSSQGLYGVTDVQVTQTSADSYQVTSTIYTPFPYDEEDETAKASAGHTLAFVYTQKQDFTFATNKRGWRLIASITNVDYRKVETIEIPVTPDKPSQKAQAANAAYSLASPAK